jgi:hypothetical protein
MRLAETPDHPPSPRYLFFRHTEPLCSRLVGEVSACGLRSCPFADVAFVGIGFLREFGGCHRSLSQRFVKSQAVPDHHHPSVYRSAQVIDKAPQEFIHVVAVHSHNFLHSDQVLYKALRLGATNSAVRNDQAIEPNLRLCEFDPNEAGTL